MVTRYPWQNMHAGIRHALTMAKVKVYRYKRFDKATGEAIVQPREATLDTIRFCGLEPLMETEREVNQSDIDDGGRVRREFWVNPRLARCPSCNEPMRETRISSGADARTFECEAHGAWRLLEGARSFTKAT